MTLTELIEAQAAATPDAPAVRFRDVTLTYAELDRAASGLAARLRERGAGPERIVAVALPRSAELVVALVAVLKAGAAYLPVDPGYPAERVAFMLADAEPVVTLRAVTLDPAARAEAGTRVDPRHPAYVIYTSGSTGRPKGVVVSHEAIVNRIRWMQAEYGLTGADRVLQKTPSSFDVSVWEFFWPLVTGATLVVAEPGGHRDAAYLAGLIQRERVTTVHFVPSMLRAFLADPEAAGCTGLRRVICSGEALPADLAADFHAVLPGCELHNLYGPTEAAVDVTYWRCLPGAEGPVPIGRPVWNTTIHVLDRDLRPAAYGELYIGGVQVARGYLRRPGLTAGRFVPDPFGPPGSRLYRTGDLARRRADGVVEYAGRADDQIKIRGFRVEPGEVEAVLAAHPGVRQAAVTAREDRPGVIRLVGYIVPAVATSPSEAPRAGAEMVDPAGLREHVAARLPAHMVPAVFVSLDAMPLTASGKLDRRALPAPEPTPAPRPEAKAHAGVVDAEGTEQVRAEAVDAEGTLAGLFAEVLRLPSVGRTDDFFELGGDSILALHLTGRARRAGLAITARQVLELGTVRALAAVAGEGASVEPQESALGAVPATPIMGWLRERGPQIDHFAQSMTLRLPQGVDGDRLTRALQVVLDHHDLLRARLTGDTLEVPPPGSVSAASLLRVVPAGDLPAGTHAADDLPGDTHPTGDLPGGTHAAGDFRADTHAAVVELPAEAVAEAWSGLAPRDGVMLRAVRLDAGPARSGLLHLVAHHLVVDGVSWRVLAEDLAHAYEGTPLTRSTSFRTWARALPALDRRAELPFWEATLAGAAEPWDLDPRLDTAATAARFTLTARLDVSLEMVLAALATAVGEQRARRGRPGGREVLVDIEGHGREDLVDGAELSRTVGWFTSISPLRLDPGPDGGADALARVARQLRAVPAKGVGYGLLRHLDPASGPALARLPRPRICVNHLGRFTGDGGDWSMVLGPEDFLDLADPGLPLAHPLTIDALVVAGPERPTLRATWTYAPRVAPEPVVRELAELWLAALGAISPSAPFLVAVDQEELDEFEETLA
ncbi:non-ribosomal peptide synthetase [Nonomuraea jiangxiensis]|uniref:Non-ribosomal peptide synthase domain TIGR01720/amino acid adenylation domain-containing protein n=1 Tax=Nonomuraea jiangxiensis TaxID=633440 RepID=A0A1G8DJ85_9ACTN|nr:non-ribosomal peptide synthetase [Nonomuraea jiangxiensis]SDH57743.1 non-ribosomal peptide synthase domain TIGR01720/amino acid adenylation domain-containing protein [Nonomuraea jiangxiensis]